MADWESAPVVEDENKSPAWASAPVVEPAAPTGETSKPSLLQTLFGGARLATDQEYAKAVAPIPEQAAPVVSNAIQAASDVARGVPGMLAQLPGMAYQGAKFATGDSQQRTEVIQEALRQAIPQGQQIAQDIQSPLGSRESFRGIANAGMLALPAVGELSGVLWPKAIERPPIQAEAPPIQSEPLIETATVKAEQLAKIEAKSTTEIPTSQEAVPENLQPTEKIPQNPENISQMLGGESQPASWVIRDKVTGESVMETFDPKKVAALNTDKYEAVPIGQYLAELNQTEGAPNAVQEPIATQPDGLRTEPQVPQETQAPAAGVGGERVPEIGQGTEVPGGAQEVAPTVQPTGAAPGEAGSGPVSEANPDYSIRLNSHHNWEIIRGGNAFDVVGQREYAIKSQAEEALSKLQTTDTGTQPVSKGEQTPTVVAEQPKIEPVSQAESPVTVQPTEGESRTTGIAQRITNVPANEGLTVQETVDRGTNLISQGVDPEEVSARVKTSKQLSVDDLSILRARTAELDKAAYAAEDAMRANPNDPVARQNWEDAVKARNDWNTEHVKPAQTIWSDLGRTQQGEADIDTGTVTGLRVAFSEIKGRDPTPVEQSKLTDFADQTKRVTAEVDQAKSKYDAVIAKETANLPDVTPDQLVFSKDFGAGVNPKSGITDLIRIIWKQAKDNYIDKGVTSLDDTIHGVALDTGLPPEQVRDALTKPKAVRQITNEMYAKMAARRNIVNAAKDYIRAKDEPMWKRVAKAVWETPFSLAIYGHGTVGGITHAGANIFKPSIWKAYWPDFVNQAKFFVRPGIHEAAMQALVRDENFITAKRAGLANDPNLTYTDYGAYAKFFGLQGGRRGFDALKTMRQSMFNSMWDKVPESIKSDPAAAKEMARGYAEMVNHATGVISNTDRGFLATSARAGGPVMFAAKLEASRWARVIGDPVKTLDTYARWNQATPAEKAVAVKRTKNAAEFAVGFLGTLYLNQAILAASGSKDKINFTDPSKSDWLKHKIAGHTVAVDGGLLAPIRLLGRLAYDTLIRPRKELRGDTRTTAAIKDVGQYAIGKAAPSISIAKEAVTAESFDGRLLPWSRDTSKKPKMTWTEYASSHGPIPLSGGIKDMYDSMRQRGMSKPDTESVLRGLAAFGSELTGARVMEIHEPQPNEKPGTVKAYQVPQPNPK